MQRLKAGNKVADTVLEVWAPLDGKAENLGVVWGGEEADGARTMSNESKHVSIVHDNLKRFGTLMSGFEFSDV